jgi:hypothetical protein
MAWRKFKDPRFLTAADWAVRALEQRPVERNPLYEAILPYAAFVAARMNAELGRDYDEAKLLNWCFEPGARGVGARPGWGICKDRYGSFDCHGLAASDIDTDGYAFAMNTFEWAGALVPLARYDTRYARAIGKWVLNLANASRLFYPNALPATVFADGQAGQPALRLAGLPGLSAKTSDHQDNRAWADKYDPNYCIAYEGLRRKKLFWDPVKRDYRTIFGRIKSGSYLETLKMDHKCEVLEEAVVGDTYRLEHVWEIPLTAGETHALWLHGRCALPGPDKSGFKFLYARTPDGPWTEMFTVAAADNDRAYGRKLEGVSDVVYVKVASSPPSRLAGAPATLYVDRLRVQSINPAISPYATGDPMSWSWGATNLGLYGSSHVGILGGIVSRTDDEKILQLDLLKTDYYHDKAYPTSLYYNPYDVEKSVEIDVAPGSARDLYDAVRHRFLLKNVTGRTSFPIPADSAVVLVLAPSNGRIVREGGKTTINEVIVDHRCK